jgi:hypothetical protein
MAKDMFSMTEQRPVLGTAHNLTAQVPFRHGVPLRGSFLQSA